MVQEEHMANGKVVRYTIDEKTLSDLTRTLASFSAASEALGKKLASLFPARRGSAVWWEKALDEAEDDIACGRVHGFSSMHDAIQWLNS